MFPQRMGAFVREESQRQNVSRVALQCPCGGDGFELRYDGTIQKHLLSGDSLVGEKTGLCLSADCPSCGRKVLLFDSMRHGYDAVNERDNRQVVERQPGKRYACKRCGGTRFGVEMRFEYAGLEDVGEELPKDECFSWLWVDIACGQCRKKKHGFVDVETA